MSYADEAIALVKLTMQTRDIDGWVVLYAPSSVGKPLYLREVDIEPQVSGGWTSGWTSGSIDNCTVFDSWWAASLIAQRSNYILGLPDADRRILRIRIKSTVEVELLEDLPINILDAMSEV